MDGCVFCLIAEGAIPSYTVYEDELFKVILDRYPWSAGHTLIIAKRHAETVYDLNGAEAAALHILIASAANAINKSLKPDGLNILQNNGVAAGQSVGHFHVHLIPRYTGDNINMTFPANDPPAEEFESLLSEIKKAYA